MSRGGRNAPPAPSPDQENLHRSPSSAATKLFGEYMNDEDMALYKKMLSEFNGDEKALEGQVDVFFNEYNKDPIAFERQYGFDDDEDDWDWYDEDDDDWDWEEDDDFDDLDYDVNQSDLDWDDYEADEDEEDELDSYKSRRRESVASDSEWGR